MNEERQKDHPVWDVYHQYMTARLNVRYYEARIKTLSRWSFWMEVLLAFSTPGSVTAWWVWQTVVGGYIWKALGSIAILLAVLKPFLKLTDRIQLKTQMLIDYRSLEHDFQKLTISIKQYDKYDKALRNQLFVLMDKKGEIMRKYTDEPNQKLRWRCDRIVRKELPGSSFFLPEEVSL